MGTCLWKSRWSEDSQPTLEYTKSISCDGLDRLVTENLSDTIEQLYQLPEVEHVWIDAICINQENLAERSQ